ncbi:MAG TPA: TolC family protein, partial [Burkholderiales bacterium]|nr:TolC family protein [Burkholderiales bacterium]
MAVSAFALLSGCTLGPDYHRPAAPGVSGYTREPLSAQTAAADIAGGDAQRFVQGLDIPAQWWTLFHSQELNRLIEVALKANPDVNAAEAALRQAMENLDAQRGALYPTAQAAFSPSRQKNATGTLAPTLVTGAPIFNLYTAQVGVAYMPDVFGGTRRSIESLEAQAEFHRFQLEATYLTLTANVVASAIQEASLRAQIAGTEKIV